MLEFLSVAFGLISIRGVEADRYLCMNKHGRLYAAVSVYIAYGQYPRNYMFLEETELHIGVCIHGGNVGELLQPILILCIRVGTNMSGVVMLSRTLQDQKTAVVCRAKKDREVEERPAHTQETEVFAFSRSAHRRGRDRRQPPTPAYGQSV